jgi:hypothetical protein
MGEMSGVGVRADTDVMVDCSAALQDTKQFLFDIASGVAGDLAASAGMAGSDGLARRFAAKYEPAASTVVAGIDKAGEGVWALADRLLTTATNYLKTDNAGAAALLGRMTPSPAVGPRSGASQCEPSNAAASLPAVTGARQTKDIPVIGDLWPQGDPDKLRAAAATWTKAAELISQAQINASNHTEPLTAAWSGRAYDEFRDYEATLYSSSPAGTGMPATAGAFMEDLAGACRSLAQACTGYADAIETCRDTLIGLAVAAGIITVVGVGLTIFTLGGSDAAAAGADAALAADAAVAVGVMEAAAGDAIALAAIEEAESIVAAAAARILVGSGVAAAVVAIPTFMGIDQAAAATGAPIAAGGATYAAFPSALQAPTPWTVIPPIPAPVPPPFGLYSPGQRQAAAAWAAGLPPRAPAYGTPDDRAYQVRTAGSPERFVRGAGPGTGVWADGFRPEDGALIDAKHVRDPGCTPRTVQGLSEGNKFREQVIYKKDGAELLGYQAALNNPANKASHLEIDTNDPQAVDYWKYQTVARGINANVRYVP